MTSWFNEDSLVVKGGRDRSRQTYKPQPNKSFGTEHEIVYKFDLTKLTAAQADFTTDRDNDGTVDGFNIGDTYIPDQAHIISANVYMTDTAAAGGTSVQFGTYQVNGTAIDADGLVTASNGATANLGANVDLTGTGALVGTAVTQKSYIAALTAGTFTGGVGALVIRYRLPMSV